MGGGPPTTRTPLEQLRVVLAAALDLSHELTADRLLVRLLEAFRGMPAGDRSTVVEAIEREVAARKLSLATEDTTGQSMVPNPNARLYLRAHETSFDRSVLERGEMTIATVRGMRAATLIPAIPDIHKAWREATLDAMRSVDEATRTTVEGLVREILGFIAEARTGESAEQPPPATPDATGEEVRRS